MNKKIFLVLYGLIFCAPAHTMEHKFHQNKQERRSARIKSYTKQDREKLIPPLAAITVGTLITCAGCIAKEPITTGFGFALMIGGIDDISHYCKYQRRYNQKTAQ